MNIFTQSLGETAFGIILTVKRKKITDELSRYDFASFFVSENGALYYVSRDGVRDFIKRYEKGELSLVKELPYGVIRGNLGISSSHSGRLLISYQGVNESDLYKGKLN